jgi:putative Ca2+/H+ antiporter (TMEM165/GDT1 family)
VDYPVDALFASTAAVAIAEIGDKTQLLSLFLVHRFREQRLAIIAGIIAATLVNHALSAWLGAIAATWLPPHILKWIVGISFIVIALWLLIPDQDSDEESGLLKYGAFVATLVLFFIAEIGDKTQIATVVLAARYDDTLQVIAGTTLGMVLANAPVVLLGERLMRRLPLDWARRGACALFLVLGVLTLLA